MPNGSSLRAFVINLENATTRWARIQETFGKTEIQFVRVPAIDGFSCRWSDRDYSEDAYYRLHGRKTNPAEVGCYLSHIRALSAFLETDSQLALICEDDIIPGPDLVTVLSRTLAARRFWNILHLNGLWEAHPLKVKNLCGIYWLCVNLGRFKGAGAYLIDRKAAQIFTRRLLPMKLPYDHAIDREWFYGLSAGCILPFPMTQRERGLRSSIQQTGQAKLPELRRWLTTYPYQAFNELMRWICRSALFASVKLRRSAKINCD